MEFDGGAGIGTFLAWHVASRVFPPRYEVGAAVLVGRPRPVGGTRGLAGW